MSTTINWHYMDRNGNRYSLNGVDLNHSHFDQMYGVYVIYYIENRYIHTVYVGQGFVRDRLGQHRNDDRIQAYAHKTLYVTWASTTISERDGIEAYLHEKLQPLVGERVPDVDPIEVNLPWE